MASARVTVLSVLATWIRLEDPPLIPERDDPAWNALSSQDRAFAFDLLNGVIRYRGLLDVIINASLKQSPDGLEPQVRAILWMGCFQLLLQSGPAYAAVDSSVDLAKQSGAGRAAGLINAGLRNITRFNASVEQRQGLSVSSFPLNFTHQVRFGQSIFPNPLRDIDAHLATVTSHPQPLVKMLRAAYGETTAVDLLIHNNMRPTTVLRSDDPAWQPATVANLGRHQVPGFFIPMEGWNAAIDTAIENGTLSLQDPTAARPIAALMRAIEKDRILPMASGPLRVLDLCAGVGFKTVQLARNLNAQRLLHFPLTQITACDVDWTKLEQLTRRVHRLGLNNVSTALASTLPQLAVPVPFHIALVDVPCSDSGAMGRRVLSRWRWPALKQDELRRHQLTLLNQAANVLAQGSLLIYSTSSIDPAENAGVVQNFLAESRSAGKLFVMHSEETTLPAITDDPSAYQSGGYFALLKKM